METEDSETRFESQFKRNLGITVVLISQIDK